MCTWMHMWEWMSKKDKISKSYVEWLFLQWCEQMYVHLRQSTSEKKSKETVLPKFSLVNLCIYWGYLQKHGKGWTYRSMGDLSLKGPLQPEQWLTQAASLKLPEQLVGSSINVYPCSSDCWLLMSSQGGALCILLSFPSPVPLAYSLPSGRGHFHPEA